MRRIIYQDCIERIWTPRHGESLTILPLAHLSYLSSNLGEKSLFGWTCRTPVRNNGLIDVVAAVFPFPFLCPFAFSSHVTWKRLLSRVRRPSLPLSRKHSWWCWERWGCRVSPAWNLQISKAQLQIPWEGFPCWTLLPLPCGRLPLLDTSAPALHVPIIHSEWGWMENCMWLHRGLIIQGMSSKT